MDDAKLIRIALAEDNPALRLVLTRTLSTESGFQLLIQAENGQKLLDCLCDTAVDIVLMDVHMPIMDGISAARRRLAGSLSRFSCWKREGINPHAVPTSL